MSFPYRKILCPIDFDDNSMQALDKAIEFARHFQAGLVIVHVLPLVLQFSDVSIPYDIYAEQQKTCSSKLATIAAQKLAGIAHEEIVYSGDVVSSILQAAKRVKPDLLVMATHGRGGLKHLLLGSVAEAVVRKASCPVLTIGRESSES